MRNFRFSGVPTAAVPRREHELKLSLPLARVSTVASRLAALAHPDSAHPENEITTLYFDDAQLSSVAEKLDGDCAKTKVRLRWYRSLDRDGSRSPVFLEIKQRFGSTRDKRRFGVELDPELILADPLSPRWGDAVGDLLRRHTGVAWSPRRPVVLLSYRRSRFVEPASRARLSLDARIRPLAVEPALRRTFMPAELPFAVVEIKSPSPDLPPVLRSLTALGCQPRALSKLALCLAARH